MYNDVNRNGGGNKTANINVKKLYFIYKLTATNRKQQKSQTTILPAA